ncbi:MAG: Y-family DNA polymerase [Bdellovibrionaceae bacterium]|nr:Y-family DNA polymerase [Pseudobdellovibrionaceae bacterium]
MSATRAKVYALVDCNSFFCSCERLFRPDLEGKPVGVLSNNDGCFVSRTPELKALGVGMAQPYFQVKDLCQKHKVAVFSANFSLYTNISHRVMMVLSEMAPIVEVYSVDEAFLDLTGVRDVERLATTIKQEVFRKVGIPVSVGLGSSKTLAKVANQWAKSHPETTNGVMSLLDPTIREQVLGEFEVGEVWGVGRASQSKMYSLGITTAKDFRDYKNEKTIQKMFTRVGAERQRELRGEAIFELDNVSIPSQSIVCSRSFGNPVLSLDELKESVAHFASYACEKLRRQKSATQRFSVFIRSSSFIAFEQQIRSGQSINLDVPTSDTLKVIRYAMRALEKLYQAGYKYKKAGVGLYSIRSQEQYQLSLVESSDTPKSQRLMQAVDEINSKEGSGTIAAGVCFLTPKKWIMNHKNRSPRYVSGWSELRKVK